MSIVLGVKVLASEHTGSRQVGSQASHNHTNKNRKLKQHYGWGQGGQGTHREQDDLAVMRAEGHSWERNNRAKIFQNLSAESASLITGGRPFHR